MEALDGSGIGPDELGEAREDLIGGQCHVFLLAGMWNFVTFE
jgi:hypothetical protein